MRLIFLAINNSLTVDVVGAGIHPLNLHLMLTTRPNDLVSPLSLFVTFKVGGKDESLWHLHCNGSAYCPLFACINCNEYEFLLIIQRVSLEVLSEM